MSSPVPQQADVYFLLASEALKLRGCLPARGPTWGIWARGERANFTGLVLGGGGGRPDYLQKLKVPEGYEKMIDVSNI